MTAPRNRAALARSQALRGAIRALLEAHPPLLPPLTARAVCNRLPSDPRPSERTVRWHIQAIRAEARQAIQMACHRGNSLSETHEA